MCGCMLVWCLDARLMLTAWCVMYGVRRCWEPRLMLTATDPSRNIIYTSLDEIWYHTYRPTSFVFAAKKRTCLLCPLDGLQSEIPSGRNPGESYGYPEVLEQCNLPGN